MLEPMNWIAWCEIASTNELDWVSKELARHKTVVPFDCEVESHKSNEPKLVMQRTSYTLQQFLGGLSPHPPQKILVASSARTDPIELLVDWLREEFDPIPIELVLGEWWSGYRRTWPLPKNVATSIGTNVTTGSFLVFTRERSLDLANHERENAPQRPQPVRGQLGLVISDDSETKASWLDLLPVMGFDGIAISPDDRLPSGAVDLIVLDMLPAAAPQTPHPLSEFSDELESDRPLETAKPMGLADRVAWLRRTYPAGRIVACFSFPRWKEVEACVREGWMWSCQSPFRWRASISAYKFWWSFLSQGAFGRLTGIPRPLA